MRKLILGCLAAVGLLGAAKAQDCATMTSSFEINQEKQFIRAVTWLDSNNNVCSTNCFNPTNLTIVRVATYATVSACVEWGSYSFFEIWADLPNNTINFKSKPNTAKYMLIPKGSKLTKEQIDLIVQKRGYLKVIYSK